MKYPDPFEKMDDDELDMYFERVFAHKPQSVRVSIRVPEDLLARAKRAAARADMPYQTLIKRVLAEGLARLEQSENPPAAQAR
jgi:predicted DNA binding CopG/RHH family protein